MSIMLPLVLGGGAAALAVTKGKTPTQTPEVSLGAAVKANPELGNGSIPGGTTTQLRNLGSAFTAKRNAIMASSSVTPLFQPLATTDLWGLQQPTVYGEIDAALQEKLDLIKAYGQKAYDSMTAEAKAAAAKALSEQLGLDPPLDGTEDWETIAKIAGGAAGLAAFGWLPGGAVWGPIVGTYLGIKIEELISKNADEIKEWFSSTWSDIEDWTKETVHDVGDWFGELF